jgi:hypothetical protein
MVKSFASGFLRAYYAPKSLYKDIAQGQAHYSWFCVLLYCLLYEIGTLWLYFNGFTPFVSPWLQIPEEIYYLVQAFYIIPLVFLMWILGTGVLHIISKLFGPKGNQGTFDTLFKMTGYSLWAPWYPLFIVDCIHSTPEWLYNIVLITCMILILIGTTRALMVERNIRLPGAIICSLLAFLSIGTILFTYIR